MGLPAVLPHDFERDISATGAAAVCGGFEITRIHGPGLMQQQEPPVGTVFFDLGQTLGEPRFDADGARLTGFDPYPWVPDCLAEQKALGRRLGVISNTGDNRGTVVDAALREAGILDCFEAGLLIYSR